MEAVAERAPLQAALRKAQWRILPLLAFGYLVAFMDRANISFAAESMNRELHFSAAVYGLGAGLFFISYAACEIPSNGMLLRFGARRWLARILLTWGLLAGAMMFVRTAHVFYGLRLLLGCAEAGYFPGVIYYLSLWFPAGQRARAISWFYVSLPLSSVLMGSVAGSLLKLDGRVGLRGWQWLFLVEALPALLLSAWIWISLPDSPKSARWLDENERAAMEMELAEDGVTVGHGSRADLMQVLREPRVWVLGLFNLCMLGTAYAVVFFLPEMVRGLTQWTAQRVGFLIAASNVAAAAAMILNAAHSDRRRERRWHVAVPMLAVGALVLVAGLDMRGMVAAAALLLITVPYMAMQGPMLVIASRLCSGKNAALAIATFNTVGMFGGFVGSYWMGWMRDLTGGYATGVGLLCVPCALAAGCVVWVTRGRAAG
ncbi:MAG TPA: MFS transporter [Acidobacteriaceae bacterium]|jgi:ACS family tartrate transporter-like MFS transporter|nr:MFS transporter [Acidobacteriaceae bacterium]